jgi:pimeloyl-ACP methyl ester carboxylesterase
MRAAGEPYLDWANSGRQFLAFDAAGDGIAVEVVGDLAAADRIAVLVPGVDTTLRDFDRGLGGVARRAPAVQARSVYAELRKIAPAQRVAVVAWLGYDPPNGIGLDAASEDSARAGASALRRFLAGLALARPSAAVTLIGHSYGALVIGLAAAALPPQVADLVTLGGIGMGADNVSDLHTTAQVWAAQAPDDWIHWIPQVRLFQFGHGVRPARASFGARLLPVAGVAGHDGYLEPGSTTLRAVAEVILALPR